MKKIVIISGPTAVGKTSISISLAHKLNGEIISADSMQVYRGMDIGSAKITPEEMGGVTHHLIDILDPNENFDVALFQKLATEAIDDICSRGKTPIIVGGTAFYIQALLYDIDFTKTDFTETDKNAKTIFLPVLILKHNNVAEYPAKSVDDFLANLSIGESDKADITFENSGFLNAFFDEKEKFEESVNTFVWTNFMK